MNLVGKLTIPRAYRMKESKNIHKKKQMARKKSVCPDGNLTIADKNICTKLLYYLDMENASNFADGIARLCYIFL